MSIPKKIHYCWFGNGKMSPLMKKCIRSWKKYCPDYEIICWNEENFDIQSNRYVKEAYESKKWAFVSDYVRLWAVYEHGGIYLDTDVELIKPINELAKQGAYMGYDEKGVVATGLGFGAEKGNWLVGEMLKDYENIPFILEEGVFDMTPCPDRNMKTLERLGFSEGDGEFQEMRFLPRDYLCPSDYYTGKKQITENTYSIHHYSASWTSKKTKRTTMIKRIVGRKLYDRLYGKFLHKFDWLEW